MLYIANQLRFFYTGSFPIMLLGERKMYLSEEMCCILKEIRNDGIKNDLLSTIIRKRYPYYNIDKAIECMIQFGAICHEKKKYKWPYGQFR